MEKIKTIQNQLEQHNQNLYIVGWFCRDKFLDPENLDWDIDLVTNATPPKIEQILNVVWKIWAKYWTCIVSEWWEKFEITTFREDIWTINNRKPVEVKFTDSLVEDAKRRDLTLNAIYYNPKTGEYIDPENWIKDIQNNTIRFVGNIENRIQEDALRILRFIRFKNKYWLNVADSNYWEIIKRNVHLLRNIYIERITQELNKILLTPNNVQALEELKKIWFLELFLPELDCLDQYNWNKHHMEWDVWVHTKMWLEEMNKIIKRENIQEKEKKLLLIWSILLHDVWKWLTYSIWKNWESNYYNHNKIWAEIFLKQISPRLNFPKQLTEKLYFIIKEHLRTFQIANMRKLKARKLMMHKYFEDLLLVSKADCYWKTPQNIESFNQITKIYNEFKEIIKTKKFLTWNDIKKKYPELEWRQIWERLKMINEQILVVD